MNDFVIIGLYQSDGIKSIKYLIDEFFSKNSHYAHERIYGDKTPRWRFRLSTLTVYWYESVSDEVKESITLYLKKHYSVEVKFHLKVNYLSPGWKIAHDIKN